MKLATELLRSLYEEEIHTGMFKTILRDGDRIFSKEKSSGKKVSTLFVSSTNDGLVIRQGASNGDELLRLNKPKITVGDLVKALDSKPHNWGTRKLDMSLNENAIYEKVCYEIN